MVVILKILGWYVAIGLVYGAYEITLLELCEWIFDNEALRDEFVRFSDETIMRNESIKSAEVIRRYKKLKSSKVFKTILADMLFWPRAIWRYDLKCLMKLHKPKN